MIAGPSAIGPAPLCLLPALTWRWPHWSRCYAPGRALPQDLCTACSLRLPFRPVTGILAPCESSLPRHRLSLRPPMKLCVQADPPSSPSCLLSHGTGHLGEALILHTLNGLSASLLRLHTNSMMSEVLGCFFFLSVLIASVSKTLAYTEGL